MCNVFSATRGSNKDTRVVVEFAEQDSLADKLWSVWGNLFVMELYELAAWKADMLTDCHGQAQIQTIIKIFLAVSWKYAVSLE